MRRNLWTIINDIAVGGIMLSGTERIVRGMHRIGQQTGLEIQESVGTIGSGIVEYGLPALFAIATLYATYRAVKAIDKLD